MEKFEELRMHIADALEERGCESELGKAGPHGVELHVEYRDSNFIVTISEE